MPVMSIEVRCPEDYFGAVVGDINSRRGMIGRTGDCRRDANRPRQKVLMAETFGCPTELRSLTQGRATYSMEFDHEEVPKSIAASLAKQAS